MLRGLKDLPAEERPQTGEQLNRLRKLFEGEIEERFRQIKEQARSKALKDEWIDITLPGTRWERGRTHPLTLVMDEIIDVFWGMGFEIARGPDIEDDYHNFEALNIPQDHPARDMQDTFFVSSGMLLRTHTSPVQIRTMESRKPPLQIIVPGAVYRQGDDDATHSPMFHQVEGFMVDRHITFADLKGVLTHVLRQIFSQETGVRFRPSFFPFHRTERRDRYPMFNLRWEGNGFEGPDLPGVQRHGLVGNPRRGHDRSAGVPLRGVRSGESLGIRFRHGSGADRDVKV